MPQRRTAVQTRDVICHRLIRDRHDDIRVAPTIPQLPNFPLDYKNSAMMLARFNQYKCTSARRVSSDFGETKAIGYVIIYPVDCILIFGLDTIEGIESIRTGHPSYS